MFSYSTLFQLASPTLALARGAITKLIDELGICPPTQTPSKDTVLEERVSAVMKTWPFEVRQAYVVVGIRFVEMAYAHLTDMDARVAIAVYTILMTALDDQEIYHKIGAQDFARMLCSGAIHDDEGPLGQTARVLTDMGKYFSAFGTTAILASTLRAFCGEMLSNPFCSLYVKPQSKIYADYQRSLTGFGEAYAVFIWCKADFPTESAYIQVIPYVNNL